MQLRALAPLTLAAALFGAPSPAVAEDPPLEFEWTDDFEAAKEQAAASKRFILADFTGSDWCAWCIKLKAEVFETPEFKAWSDENVVLLELDFPRAKQLPARVKAQNEELRDKFAVQGYPTIVFMDAEGNEVGRTGYKAGGPAVWIAAADEFLGRARTYRDLSAKAERTPAEEAELLSIEIAMGKLDLAAAKDRLAGLKGLSAEQVRRVEAALTDLEVTELVKKNPPRGPADMAALGAKFAALFAAGRVPTSQEAAGPFFVGLAEHAYAQKDARLLEAAIEGVKERFGTGRDVMRFVDAQTKRLEELRAGD